MPKFRIGLSRDVADTAGKPTFDPAALRVIEDDPLLEWEWFGDGVREVTTREFSAFDGICLGGPPVRAGCLGAAGARTRIIARFGVGYDHCDVRAMTANGVLLTINPDGVRRAVATGVLGFILALAHRIFTLDRLVRGNAWQDRMRHFGTGLVGRTLGLIGVGNIGREIFRLARPLELRHIAHDPFAVPADLQPLGVTLDAFDAVVAQADFLVVSCPLNENTRGLIGERAFGLMKPTAFLINAARGPIVDEAALIGALQSRRIAGAALDVFEQEPTSPDNPLLALDNVILSPHTLCYTDEALRLMAEGAFRAVRDFFHHRVPNKIINTELLATPALRKWFAAP
jgi:D-3-phosphoglycerate dehydrogenase